MKKTLLWLALEKPGHPRTEGCSEPLRGTKLSPRKAARPWGTLTVRHESTQSVFLHCDPKGHWLPFSQHVIKNKFHSSLFSNVVQRALGNTLNGPTRCYCIVHGAISDPLEQTITEEDI